VELNSFPRFYSSRCERARLSTDLVCVVLGALGAQIDAHGWEDWLLVAVGGRGEDWLGLTA